MLGGYVVQEYVGGSVSSGCVGSSMSEYVGQVCRKENVRLFMSGKYVGGSMWGGGVLGGYVGEYVR